MRKGLLSTALFLLIAGWLLMLWGRSAGGGQPVTLQWNGAEFSVGPRWFQISEADSTSSPAPVSVTSLTDDDLAGVTELQVALSFGSLSLSAGDTFQASGSGRTLACTVEDGILLLTEGDGPSGRIDITLPSTLNLSRILVSGQSGDLSLSGLTAGVIDVSNEFGAVRMNDITAGQLTVSVSGGELTISDARWDWAGLSTEWGSISATRVVSGGADLSGELGDITLTGRLTGATNVQTEAGSIRVETDLSGYAYSGLAGSEMGTVTIDGSSAGTGARLTGDGPHTLELSSELGSIDLRFGQETE